MARQVVLQKSTPENKFPKNDSQLMFLKLNKRTQTTLPGPLRDEKMVPAQRVEPADQAKKKPLNQGL